MARIFALGLVVAGLFACANDLAPGGPAAGGSSNQPRDLRPAGENDAPATDDDAAPADDAGGDDDDAPAPPADEPATPEAPAEETPVAPGPPPADAGQSCQEWSDCGPHYADLNSGFDCAQGTCACNVDGNWDDACSQIGGVWSPEDCFCFVGAAPRPAANANDWVASDEDPADYEESERSCWWTWRETCEPDTWVDGGYEWVCNGPSSDDCGYEHDENGGYWESGDCDGYWLRRCDDGTQKRYG